MTISLFVEAGPGTGKTQYVVSLADEHAYNNDFFMVTAMTRPAISTVRERLMEYSQYIEPKEIKEIVRTTASLGINLLQIEPKSVFENAIKDIIMSGKGHIVRDFFRKNFNLDVNPRALLTDFSVSVNEMSGDELYYHLLNYVVRNEARVDLSDDALFKNYKSFKEKTAIYNPKVNKLNFDVFKNFYDKFFKLFDNGFVIGNMNVVTSYPVIFYNVMKDYRDYFDYIIVDEFNEISNLEYRMLESLAKNLEIFGNVLQSIYSFHDNIDVINDAFDRAKERKTLKIQYRIYSAIWNEVRKYGMNVSKSVESLFRNKKLGDFIYEEFEEMEVKNQGGFYKFIQVRSDLEALNAIRFYLNYFGVEDTVILTRRRDMSKFIDRKLRDKKVLLELDEYTESFLNKIKMLMDTDIDIGFDEAYGVIDERIIKMFKLHGFNSINNKSIKKVFGSVNNFLKSVFRDKYENVIKYIKNNDPFIYAKVNTIHKMKGKERMNIIVYYDFPKSFIENKVYLNVYTKFYERCVIFVGITRAVRNLILISKTLL